MASFEREFACVQKLAISLQFCRRFPEFQIDKSNPNLDQETGVDVNASNGNNIIGIQVTELDAGTNPGEMRAYEKKAAAQKKELAYFMWGQNDPDKLLNGVIRSITRKVSIANKHDLSAFDEVWLLICSNLADHGGAVSTFLPFLDMEKLNTATQDLLLGSKYHRVFIHPQLAINVDLYQWFMQNNKWEEFHKPIEGPSFWDLQKQLPSLSQMTRFLT